MQPGIAIVSLWLCWLVSWIVAAAWSARTESRPALRPEIFFRIVMLAGTVLMLVPAHGYNGPLRVWHIGWDGAWICVSLVALGIAIAWWARIYLGKLWSARVTRKVDHRVIEGGPYAFVRHPIYTGLLLSIIATAAAKGTVPGIAGCVLLVAGLCMKARVEERWLEGELGAGDYAAYKARVPMLIPFWPVRATRPR